MSYTVYENSMEWNYNDFHRKNFDDVLYDYFDRESYDSGVKFKTYEEAKKYFDKQIAYRKELKCNNRGHLVFYRVELVAWDDETDEDIIYQSEEWQNSKEDVKTFNEKEAIEEFLKNFDNLTEFEDEYDAQYFLDAFDEIKDFVDKYNLPNIKDIHKEVEKAKTYLN